jgi:hypothetical protein
MCFQANELDGIWSSCRHMVTSGLSEYPLHDCQGSVGAYIAGWPRPQRRNRTPTVMEGINC